MTLNELYSKFYIAPSTVNTPMMVVFDEPEDADAYALTALGIANYEYEIALVLQSSLNATQTLREEWANAEVKYFHAVEPNKLIVVVEKVNKR